MDYLEKISKSFDSKLLSNSTIRMSKFVHLLEKDNVICLYNASNLKRIFGNEILKNLFYDLQETKHIDYLERIKTNTAEAIFNPFILKLIKDKYVLVDNYTEEDYVNELRMKSLGSIEIDNIFIYVTEKCNLSCRYCYVQQNIEQKKEMDIETSVSTCNYIHDLIKQENIKKLYVVFYGGEPFLNLNIVENITNTLNTLAKDRCKIYYRIITNGCFLNDKNIGLIQKLNIIPSISMDGPKDVMLKTRTNAKEYESILQGIKKLKEHKIKYEISFTISQGNINCLVESIEYIINEIRPFSIRLNVPEFSENTKGFLSNDFFKKIGKQMKHVLYLLANSRLECCNLGYENFKNQEPSFFPCSGCGKRLAILPDGTMSRCESFVTLEKHILGKLDKHSKICFNEKEDKMWLRRSGYYIDDCKKCIALGLCAGGCAYNAELYNGDFFAADYTLCEWAKSLTKEFIFNKFPKIGGELT